jgi:hypothetical protein
MGSASGERESFGNAILIGGVVVKELTVVRIPAVIDCIGLKQAGLPA